MTLRRLAFALSLLLLCLGIAAPAAAQSNNPFMGAPQREQSAQPAREAAAKPGLLARAMREMLQWQRRMNMALAAQMRAIRDGDGFAAAFGSLLAGMGLAFLYGAFHVAGPGHGKAVIVSYFLGREAKLARGLWLGLQIAATHVVAAIVLVWLADVALRQAFGGTPAELRAVQAVSYSAIVAIGLHMLWQAARRLAGRPTADLCAHDHHHAHHHDHGHDTHDHGAERARQGALSFAVGLVPCTGATLVMLYALANGIVGAGILMVVGIGLGMAAAMAAIGVATILARRAALARLPAARGDGRASGILQLAAGLAICLLGALMLYGALSGSAPPL
ncbi:MAG: nickel/cobalt transporter [Alphaproteobacteria bacterium]